MDEIVLFAFLVHNAIMRFNNAVPTNKRDPDLINKFRMEADGIFLFALEGLKRLMSNNYVFSETDVNRAELQQYRENNDSMLSFVKECCEIDIKFHVSSTEIFNAYKVYCEESGLKPFLMEQVGGIEILEPGCKKIRINPAPAGLKWFKIKYPTPYGILSVSYDISSGEEILDINGPYEVEIVR